MPPSDSSALPTSANPTTRAVDPGARASVQRWLPFVAAALISILLSAHAPHGRRPFEIDWSVSVAALQFSIVKPPHIAASAVLALVGLWGSGPRRWPLALSLTLLVGAAWELAQTTVISHEARLSDLAPDLLGALLGCLLGVAAAWVAAPAPRESCP